MRRAKTPSKQSRGSRNSKTASRGIPPTEDSRLPVPEETPAAEGLSVFWTPLLYVAAAWFFIRGDLKWVWFWLIAEAVIWVFRSITTSRDPGNPGRPAPAPLGAVLAVVSCLSLLALVAATLPAYHWIFPQLRPFNAPFIQGILLFVIARLVFACRALPATPPGWDLSPWITRILLGLILIGAAYLRFHRLGDIPGTYWDDCAEEMVSGRIKVDFHFFDFIVPPGSLEPFFPYFGGLVFFLLPDLPSIVVHRIILSLIGMASLWVFYLIGKELGGRRLGLLLAGLGAVSKPLVMLSSMIYLRFNSVLLGVVVALLFLFRLLRKPDLSHFLQWGAATAFGVYTYASFRPFFPFFIFSVLCWVWSDREERKSLRTGDKFFLAAVTTLVAAFCVYTINFWKYPNTLSRMIAESGIFLPAVLVAVLLPAYFRFVGGTFAEGRHPKWSAWVAGTFVAVLLASPVLASPIIQGRLASLNMFGGMNPSQVAQRLMEQFHYLTNFMFFGQTGGPDCPVASDAFFCFPSALAIALGLAVALSRLGLKNLFLLGASLVGVSTFLLSGDAHTGKIMSAAAPLLVLGALGMDRVIGAARAVFPSRLSGWVLAFLTAVFLAGAGVLTYQRCYPQYMDGLVDSNSLTARLAAKDSRAHRVYLAAFDDYKGSFAAWGGIDVLVEKMGVGFLYRDNVIVLGPGEAGKDLVIILSPPQTELENMLRKKFPAAEFQDVFNASSPGSPAVLRRAWIPWPEVIKASASRKRKKLEPRFHVRQSGETEWSRTYYSHLGLARGYVLYQDRAPDLNAPRLFWKNYAMYTARFVGGVAVDRPGKYLLTYDSQHSCVVKVDGKTILDDRPIKRMGSRRVDKKLSLTAGVHRVELLVDYANDGPAPWVSFRSAENPNAPALPLAALPVSPAK